MQATVRTFSPSVFAASSFFFFFLAVPAASSAASGTHHEPSAMEVVLGTHGRRVTTGAVHNCLCLQASPLLPDDWRKCYGPHYPGLSCCCSTDLLACEEVHNAYQGLEPYLPGIAGTTLLHDDSGECYGSRYPGLRCCYSTDLSLCVDSQSGLEPALPA